MQPFFKSTYGSIVPFEMVASIQNYYREIIDINTKFGPPLTKFTFKDATDKETQLKNYENYLINQYKLKELQ